MQLLIRSSARPNKKRLAPAICAAAKRADIESIELLLDMGVSIVDACKIMPHWDGRTGLHYAAISGSKSTVYLMLAALMNSNMRDRCVRTLRRTKGPRAVARAAG
jgi:ankyrin repeat protein